ncbi:hypothetical protein CRG98_029963 [Punica granatum]|uniref:Prolyl 4-hydroxylase alpha subunit domain-containing protein n=1 Tax=Punica granatum TaxID=22663 RepID=A0A2I0J1P5_PUNGR|nr:hypothetical protein CRG98_029963 [Punica granatum]
MASISQTEKELALTRRDDAFSDRPLYSSRMAFSLMGPTPDRWSCQMMANYEAGVRARAYQAWFRRGEIGALIFYVTMVLGTFILIFHLLNFNYIAGIPFGREEGVEGTVSLPNDLSFIRLRALNRVGGLGQRRETWVEALSWEPRAFLYHNFLSKEECEYLRRLPDYEKSDVNLPPSGGYDSNFVGGLLGWRWIWTGFLERGKYKVIKDIEKRIADFTFIPPEHGEGLQLIMYELMASYYPHFDYFTDESNTTNGGQRIATMIMYLSDAGGETIFPAAKGNFKSIPEGGLFPYCRRQGLAVIPKQGDALFFWNVRPDGTPDPSSLHGQWVLKF